MPGDFGDFSVNIGLGINFLAGGTLSLNSNDTLSYKYFPGNVLRRFFYYHLKAYSFLSAIFFLPGLPCAFNTELENDY